MAVVIEQELLQGSGGGNLAATSNLGIELVDEPGFNGLTLNQMVQLFDFRFRGLYDLLERRYSRGEHSIFLSVSEIPHDIKPFWKQMIDDWHTKAGDFPNERNEWGYYLQHEPHNLLWIPVGPEPEHYEFPRHPKVYPQEIGKPSSLVRIAEIIFSAEDRSLKSEPRVKNSELDALLHGDHPLDSARLVRKMIAQGKKIDGVELSALFHYPSKLEK